MQIYPDVPSGIIFKKNEIDIDSAISRHQALVVEEWIQNHPDVHLNPTIWYMIKNQFGQKSRIAIKKEGIYILNSRGETLCRIKKYQRSPK